MVHILKSTVEYDFKIIASKFQVLNESGSIILEIYKFSIYYVITMVTLHKLLMLSMLDKKFSR